MGKNFLQVTLIAGCALFCFGSNTAKANSTPGPYIGCDCAALGACITAMCIVELGGCLYSSTARCWALEACMKGGLKHCTNQSYLKSTCLDNGTPCNSASQSEPTPEMLERSREWGQQYNKQKVAN